jgi:PAS domain S-box-containing protein
VHPITSRTHLLVTHVDTHRNTPDPDATGRPEGLQGAPESVPREARRPSREAQEREAARRRGRSRREQNEGGHDPEIGRADPELVHHAFAALAENVRDYAIFLMDRDGIIRFWGEGARIIKRWTKEEAEGAHLRLLYLDGGSEDGTAEGHLRDAAERGESVGEGQRVRGDGRTFWARATLTALRDESNTLLGFTKVTIDLTAQRAADAHRALERRESELREALSERTDLRAEVQVLREELAVLRQEMAERSRDQKL